MTHIFDKYIRMNPETKQREWLPDTPNHIKQLAKGYKTYVSTIKIQSTLSKLQKAGILEDTSN